MMKHGLLIVIFITISIDSVSSQCENTADQYTCTNGNEISCTLYQDNRNDCEDNSDEGYTYACREVGGEWQFKCTMEGLETNVANCQVQVKISDLYADCPDASDERVYVGDGCVDIENWESTIGCDIFMVESFCNTTNQCDCRSGTYIAARNTDCIIRVIGDSCSTQADCEDANELYICSADNTCQCQLGYTAQSETTCVGLQLDDACRSDADCLAAIDNSQCTSNTTDSSQNVCQCQDSYLAESTTSCNSRQVGDSCETDEQCRFHLSEFSECNSMDQCACVTGAYSSDGGSHCQQYLLFESCIDDSSCAQIDFAECANGTCQCENESMVYDHLLRDCAFGLGDLYCETAENCEVFFNDTICSDNICLCDSGYFADTVLTCTMYQLGDTCSNDSDCGFISNAACFNVCSCIDDYEETGPFTCEAVSEPCGFVCRQPWAVALIVIIILGFIAIIVVVVLIVLKKMKFAKMSKDVEQGADEKYRTKSAKVEKSEENSTKPEKTKQNKTNTKPNNKSTPASKAAVEKGSANGVTSPAVISVASVDADIMLQQPPAPTSASVTSLNRGRLMTPVEKTRAEKSMSANPTKKKKKGKKIKKATSETNIPAATDDEAT